jgi:hypothetical protein
MLQIPKTARKKKIIASLLGRNRQKMSTQERIKQLDQLLDWYDDLTPADTKTAQTIRKTCLLTIEYAPEIIREERFSQFLADHIESEDFAELEWKTPEAVINYCELLYSVRFRSDSMAKHVRCLEEILLRYALQQYERRGAHEKMFRLLKLAPPSLSMTDAELRRLKNRTYLYEMRRVNQNHRYLYIYLVVQTVLIGVVFPLLFIHAENEALQQHIGRSAQYIVQSQPQQFLSYLDGLYWAIVTAVAIGYGDIAPVTGLGKLLAGTLGVLGVLTTGVVAGLILNWLSERRLD